MERKRKKRVFLTVEVEPYERLRLNIHRAGLPHDFFSKELNRVIVAIDQVVQEMIDLQAQGETLCEENVMELLRKTGVDSRALDPLKPDQKTPK